MRITKKDYSRSTEKALKLLNCFLEKEEWGVTELSRELDLGKASVSRLVAAFEGNGFLVKNDNTGKYRLGIQLMRFGLLFQERNELVNIVSPIMNALSKKFQATTHLGIMYGSEVLIISKVSAGQFVFMTSRIGATLSAYASASGKCLLAYLNEEQKSKYINENDFYSFTGKTITDPAVFAEELKLVQRRGYAVDDEEYAEGLFCVAVPILDLSGRPIAVISVSGSKAALKQKEKEIARDLSTAIKEIIR